MALIKAKCSNCGANLKVNNQNKTGICDHCGASYITEDVVVNNITNIKISENVNGVDLKRQAVLENLLFQYYSGKFNDVSTIREYALKVQEYDLNNALAHFVVFNNIDSSAAIKKLLGNKDVSISLELFIVFLNICGDDLNNSKIIENIVSKYKDIDKIAVLRQIINNYRKNDITFIINLIYNFKLTEDENNIILDELYNNDKTNKIKMVSQLTLFAEKHKDFLYDKQIYKNYADYWKQLKEKQMALRKETAQLEQIKNNEVDFAPENKKTKKPKVWVYISVGAVVLLGLLIVGLIIL